MDKITAEAVQKARDNFDFAQTSKIYCNNLWVEDIFEWLYQHVMNSGGDGCGALVCENYIEAYHDFKNYVRDNHDLNLDSMPHQLKRDNSITISDGNENWSFTNDPNLFNNPYHEYSFIVTTKCGPGWTKGIGTLLPIKT